MWALGITLMKILLHVLMMVGVASLVGCTTRFIGDFEADSVGAPPQTAPDGAPDDQLFPFDLTGSIRVTNASPLDGSQSVRMLGPTGTGVPATFMYAEALANIDQSVFASWLGRISSSAAVRIDFWTGHFDNIVRIELAGGQVRIQGETVGTYSPNEVHTFFIGAHPSTDQVTVSAFGGVSSGLTSTTAVSNPTLFPGGNIGLTMTLTSGSSSQGYVFDAVRMSERRPSRRG